MKLHCGTLAMFIFVFLTSCGLRRGDGMRAQTESPVTTVTIGDKAALTHVTRLGVNLGPQAFYASLQILKNLVSRNPGFESQQWQTIVQCTSLVGNLCGDGLSWGRWPDGFLDGFQFEVLSGRSAGARGTVLHSRHAEPGKPEGFTVQLRSLPADFAVGDSVAIRGESAGQATFGWAAQATGGASVTGETTDLSPHTPGKQAVALSAGSAGQSATLVSYFDSTVERPYLRIRGDYVLRFRAKSKGRESRMQVRFQRVGKPSFLEQSQQLSSDWHDYELRFNVPAGKDTQGTLVLQFSVAGGDVLLDDVALEEATANGTAFRNDVLAALQQLHPGVIRWMDSGQNWGSSIANMLAPPFGRKAAGYSPGFTFPQDASVGLQEFLELCEKVGAEPWFTLPMTTTVEEAQQLIEYMAGPESTPMGKLRARRGHPVPWSTTFPQIHLEFGNETWNWGQHGAILRPLVAYEQRANFMAATLRGSPWFSHGHFNLIADAQAGNLWLTKQLSTALHGYDAVDIAPYTFGDFRNASSVESIYGPMLAEPEMLTRGLLKQHADILKAGSSKLQLAVYEVNIGTTTGAVSQSDLDTAIPSLGAGLSTVLQMLLMERDLHVRTQCLFQLTGRSAPFINQDKTKGTANLRETSPVWPIVVDMGGPANRVRPVFLAAQLANEATLPTMQEVQMGGLNPTWDQKDVGNGQIKLADAHEVQAFAFRGEGTRHSLILFNLSRTTVRDVRLEGPGAPTGKVQAKVLTSKQISDGNQDQDLVQIKPVDLQLKPGGPALQLAPFSMTVLWYER